MYPLIFAWKPLFLQVLCDADCFHISVVQQCCCLDIYRCGLTGERQNCWICLPWQSCFLKTEQFLKRKVTISPDDTYTGAAPLEFRFVWRDEDSGGESDETVNLRYEWNFSRDAAFNDIFLTRFDAETIYSFQESGMFYVRLIITDIETEETNISGTFMIRITESELKVPNAFSPNGDGVNDVFRVKHKSLVRFNAYIFNRWGQELYRWGLQNIDAGWDGTAHGKNVPEGVYFIVVEAEGADGVNYKIKSDINILR